MDDERMSEYITPDMVSTPVTPAAFGICRALGRIEQSAMVDGAHHKQWVLDQVVRALLGPRYAEWVRRYNADGAVNEYELWDTGIAP